MKNTFRKVTAGLLTLALVAGAAPANVGGFLTGGTVIAASAETHNEPYIDENDSSILHLAGSGWDRAKLFSTVGVSIVSDDNASGYNDSITKIVADEGTVLPADCQSLFVLFSCVTEIDLSKADSSNVTDMSIMFGKGWKLNNNTISLLNVTRNTSLSTIIFGDHFDTTNVNNMYRMFSGCYYLTSLDLSSFNTSQVTNMGEMFNGCSNLTTVTVGNRWNTDLVTSSSSMFGNCGKIEGGKGTKLNNNITDKTYAHIDGGTNAPGYLTAAVTYTLVPEKAATCNTAGNSEYYIGSDDKYYSKDGDTYTAIEENSWVISATGVHTYNETSAIWTWIKNNGVYTVSAKFKCRECGDIVDPGIKPTLTETENNGMKTYTASVDFGGRTYTSTKSEQVNYSITVNNVTGNYKYGEQIKAVAPAPDAGMFFDGWYEVRPDNTEIRVSGTRTYYFYATRDMTIVPHYSLTAVEAQPVYSMNVSRVAIPESGKQKISFTVDWELPSGYELVEAGVVRSYENKDPVIDGENVSKKASTLRSVRGTFIYNLTLGKSNADRTIYSKAYVTYKNKTTNETVTGYTGVFTSDKV